MRRTDSRGACLLAVLLGALTPAPAAAGGQQSQGNVDGLLTWSLGDLQPGQSAEVTVRLVTADSLAAARKLLANLPPEAPRAGAASAVADRAGNLWIDHRETDFALAPDGAFFWESGGRQALCRRGKAARRGKEWTPPAPSASDSPGQLSRLGYYLHFGQAPARHAGVRIDGAPRLDGLKIVEPTQAAPQGLLSRVATADGGLELLIESRLGAGAWVLQSYRVRNLSQRPVAAVRLSVYANLEADHSSEDDVALLDRDSDALAIVDPMSGVACVLAGSRAPESGWAGTWPSQAPLAAGDGLPRSAWQPVDVPAAQASGVEPPTVSLTAEQAEAALDADYLLQAEGQPLAERIVEELRWARQAAARLSALERGPDLAAELAELDQWERQRAGALSAESQRRVYLAVRRVKRRILLRNPLVDFQQLVFIDQPYPHGREWQHQARHRNGMMATPGGRLLLVDGLSPAGKLRKLVDLPPGSYWRPDVSWDGQRVAFCYKGAAEPAFHLYEVGIDGSGLRKLTDGEFDDLDPVYLPDGGIAFSSTRTRTFVRCMPYTYVYTLCRLDAPDGPIRFISHNNEPDWTPSVLNDGRLLYTRWEYTDKALWRIQSLWTARPDGTHHAVFYGNQSVWPDHLGEARAIPGSEKVIFTGMAHHDYFAGSLGMIDPARGTDYPAGLTHLTPEIPWPECGPGPHDARLARPDYHHRGRKGNYKSPYPLSEEYFLVSVDTGPYSLYLMDVYGNKELIYRGLHNAWYPTPVRARRPPPALPNLVEWPGPDRAQQKPGVLFSSDVYEGSGIPRGLVKYLRVVEAESTTFTTWERDFRFEGPAISAVEADNVKRILGTAPVEEDGSFHVEVPSGKTVHFQLLDAEQRALQTMRSFTGLMPGERRGCVGCHENQGRAPVGGQAAALRRPPSALTPPPWGGESIRYTRLVQPVLDRYCLRCHDGGAKAASPNLAARPGEAFFSASYLYLVRSGLAGVIQAEKYDLRDPAAYRTLPPLAALSYRSRLVELAGSGKHHGVRVDETSRLQLIGWIDANGPYRGLEDVRAIDDPRCRDAPRVARP